MAALLRRIAARFRLRGDRDDSGDRTYERPVDNVDGLAAAGVQRPDSDAYDVGSVAYPPGYVKSYDEGRPKK